MDLRTEMEKLAAEWRKEVDADYPATSRDPVDITMRRLMVSMAKQLEARLKWTARP